MKKTNRYYINTQGYYPTEGSLSIKSKHNNKTSSKMHTKNITGGITTHKHLNQACSAAVEPINDGYVYTKKGRRLVSEVWSNEGQFLGYHLNDYE